MTVVVLVCAVLLTASGVLAALRVERGPGMLDRTVGLDILTSAIVGAVALEAAWSRRTDTVLILVALSMVGFVSSVAIARFAAHEPQGAGRVLSRAEVAVLEAQRLAAEQAEDERLADEERAESDRLAEQEGLGSQDGDPQAVDPTDVDPTDVDPTDVDPTDVDHRGADA